MTMRYIPCGHINGGVEGCKVCDTVKQYPHLAEQWSKPAPHQTPHQNSETQVIQVLNDVVSKACFSLSRRVRNPDGSVKTAGFV